MSFSEILKQSVDRVDGAVSAIIFGVDGMMVEEYESEVGLNMADFGAEATQVIKNLDTVTANLDIGQSHEFSVLSEKFGIITRKINADYYIAMVLKPGGNFGKGRFILKMAVPKLATEF